MTTTGIIVLIVAVVALAAVGWYMLQQQRSKRLRSRFGPEYEFAMREFGSRPKAEDALAAREKRMEKIQVRPLSHEDHVRFADQWRTVQSKFVDDPGQSIDE